MFLEGHCAKAFLKLSQGSVCSLSSAETALPWAGGSGFLPASCFDHTSLRQPYVQGVGQRTIHVCEKLPAFEKHENLCSLNIVTFVTFQFTIVRGQVRTAQAHLHSSWLKACFQLGHNPSKDPSLTHTHTHRDIYLYIYIYILYIFIYTYIHTYIHT